MDAGELFFFGAVREIMGTRTFVAVYVEEWDHARVSYRWCEMDFATIHTRCPFWNMVGNRWVPLVSLVFVEINLVPFGGEHPLLIGWG